MRYEKPPIPLRDQLELLKSRWLSIRNEPDALHRLEHTGYFRLTGYLKYFQGTDNAFFSGATFEDAWDLYVFDRKLRLLTLDAVEKIEISFKANVNHYMSLIGGSFWYTNTDFFNLKDEKAVEMFGKFQARIRKVQTDSPAVFVEAYFKKYTDETFLPGWMLFEELTIGEISSVYRILKPEYRKGISKTYGTYHDDLWAWMFFLTNVRNISAHHSRLWNRRYVSKPRARDVVLGKLYQKETNASGIQEAVPNYYNASLVIHYLLNFINKDFSWLEDLETLFSEYPRANKASMGFHDGSFDILRSV